VAKSWSAAGKRRGGQGWYIACGDYRCLTVIVFVCSVEPPRDPACVCCIHCVVADKGGSRILWEGGPQANLGRHGRKKAPFYGIFGKKAPFFWRSVGRGGGSRPLRPPPWIRPWLPMSALARNAVTASRVFCTRVCVFRQGRSSQSQGLGIYWKHVCLVLALDGSAVCVTDYRIVY